MSLLAFLRLLAVVKSFGSARRAAYASLTPSRAASQGRDLPARSEPSGSVICCPMLVACTEMKLAPTLSAMDCQHRKSAWLTSYDDCWQSRNDSRTVLAQANHSPRLARPRPVSSSIVS